MNKIKNIFILLIIVFIIFFCIYMLLTNKDVKDNNSKELKPGVWTDTSELLKKTRNVGSFEISDISLIYEEGKNSIIKFKVKNTGLIDTNETKLRIKFVNSKGDMIKEANVYVISLQTSKETIVKTTIAGDVSNAADIILYESVISNNKGDNSYEKK